MFILPDLSFVVWHFKKLLCFFFIFSKAVMVQTLWRGRLETESKNVALKNVTSTFVSFLASVKVVKCI